MKVPKWTRIKSQHVRSDQGKRKASGEGKKNKKKTRRKEIKWSIKISFVIKPRNGSERGSSLLLPNSCFAHYTEVHKVAQDRIFHIPKTCRPTQNGRLFFFLYVLTTAYLFTTSTEIILPPSKTSENPTSLWKHAFSDSMLKKMDVISPAASIFQLTQTLFGCLASAS